MYVVAGDDAQNIIYGPLKIVKTTIQSAIDYILGDNPHFAVGILCCPCITVVIVLVVLVFFSNLGALLVGIPSLITHLFPMLVCYA